MKDRGFRTPFSSFVPKAPAIRSITRWE